MYCIYCVVHTLLCRVPLMPKTASTIYHRRDKTREQSGEWPAVSFDNK